MSELNHPNEGQSRLTAVGCVVTLLATALIFGVALPIVRWRDPETGQALPRVVAIVCPILIGAAFSGLASLLLKLVGLPVWEKQEKDECNRPEE